MDFYCGVRMARLIALFAWLISHQPWLISHQPAVLFSQNKSATSNQPAVFFSQNKPASATSQPNRLHVVWVMTMNSPIARCSELNVIPADAMQAENEQK
jgi:hypothetical protein